MLQTRTPQLGLLTVEIDFGSGSRAKKYYDRLMHHIPTMKHVLRGMGNKEDAYTLYLWTRTSRSRPTAIAWTVLLEPDEWQALSRGLRHTGTKGRSLLEWINRHKENSYE